MRREGGEREKVTLKPERKEQSAKNTNEMRAMKHWNNDQESDRLIKGQQVRHFLKQTS